MQNAAPLSAAALTHSPHSGFRRRVLGANGPREIKNPQGPRRLAPQLREATPRGARAPAHPPRSLRRQPQGEKSSPGPRGTAEDWVRERQTVPSGVARVASARAAHPGARRSVPRARTKASRPPASRSRRLSGPQRAPEPPRGPTRGRSPPARLPGLTPVPPAPRISPAPYWGRWAPPGPGKTWSPARPPPPPPPRSPPSPRRRYNPIPRRG